MLLKNFLGFSIQFYVYGSVDPMDRSFMAEKVKNIMSVTSNCRFNMVWTGPKKLELNQNFLNGSQKPT